MVSEMVVSCLQVSLEVCWKVCLVMTLVEKLPSMVAPASVEISVPKVVEAVLSIPTVDVMVLSW